MAASGRLRKVLNGEDCSVAMRLLVTALVPFSFLYGAIMRLRRAAYRRGSLRVNRLARPVVSVGNITAGGTGKTPVTAWIARYFIQQGLQVAVLSRGYGGKGDGRPRIVCDGRQILLSADEAGDEPVLLAQLVPGLIVVTGHDRYEAGLLAQERLQPDLFILDDGFQHIRLDRDLDILLLDACRPFGNGHVLPAGLLREPQSAVGNADFVIHTRSAGAQHQRIPEIPECHASHVISRFVDFSTGCTVDKPGGRGVAFAAIADPEKFFADLEKAGLDTAQSIAFDDHAVYDSVKIGRLLEAAQSGAAYFVTTAKDAVKIGENAALLNKPLYVAELTILFNDTSLLEQTLRRFL